MEVTIEQLMMIIGQQTVRIQILELQLAAIKEEVGAKKTENTK